VARQPQPGGTAAGAALAATVAAEAAITAADRRDTL